MKSLWSKFLSLPSWKQMLIALGILLLLPIAILVLLFYLCKTESSANKILKHSVDTLKERSDDRVKEAKEKDRMLQDQEEKAKVERKAIEEEIKKNVSANISSEASIDKAESIDELRKIARNLRGNYTNED